MSTEWATLNDRAEKANEAYAALVASARAISENNVSLSKDMHEANTDNARLNARLQVALNESARLANDNLRLKHELQDRKEHESMLQAIGMACTTPPVQPGTSDLADAIKALAGVRYEAQNETLRSVVASLRAYPVGGGDVEIMAQVDRLLSERETAVRASQTERCINICLHWHRYSDNDGLFFISKIRSQERWDGKAWSWQEEGNKNV